MNIGLFILYLFTTFFMTGLIWFVQVVHYPLFSSISTQDFVSYEMKHKQRTSFVVMPVMLFELFLSVYFFFYPIWNHSYHLFVVSSLCTLLIWLTTFFIQMPLHQKLSYGFQHGWYSQLVYSNWLRTCLWSTRSLLLSIVLYVHLRAMSAF